MARRREENSLESARSLLGTLQKPNLADILRPDWDARESTARAVQLLDRVAKLFFFAGWGKTVGRTHNFDKSAFLGKSYVQTFRVKTFLI